MAIKGISMPGGIEGIGKLFTPDFAKIIDEGLMSNLVIDAIGQVFYSLSIMMAIMIAYGSYLSDSANIAKDATVIAFADLGVSILSGIVMFTTMYGVGMTINDMSASGIATAFIIFPQAIANLTNTGWVNAIFGMIFYLCLASLAVDSAFSMLRQHGVVGKFVEFYGDGIASVPLANRATIGPISYIDYLKGYVVGFGSIMYGLFRIFE